MESEVQFTFDGEAEVLESAAKKRDEILKYATYKRNFIKMRSNLIKNYFIRLSFGQQIALLSKLLDGMRTLKVILQILQIMYFGKKKMDLYEYIQQKTNFNYDKVFPNHNRMLDEKVLNETIESDATWYATMDEMSQVVLFVDLLRIAGGGVQRKMNLPILRCYHEKMKQYRKLQIGQLPKINSVVLVEYSEDIANYDAKHPTSIEVEKQRKRWDEIMRKYQSEVNTTTKQLIDEQFSTRNQPGYKSPAALDQNRKETTMDAIQLLPVWIVKKIFGYLSNAELQIARKVNGYWAYAVQEILREQKSRQNLDSFLEYMKAGIDSKKLAAAIEEFQLKKCLQFKKPKKKITEVGITSKKLISNDRRLPVETSLTSELQRLRNLEIHSFSGELLTFPRIIQEDLNLFRHRPCFLKDTNVRIGIEEDIGQQRSMLTYSLSTLRSSLNIGLNQDQLSDW